MKGYPRWFTTGLVNVIILILFVSGIILMPTAFENHLEWEMPWRVSASGRIGVAATHAFFAFLTAMLLGALWSIHMRSEWRKGGNRFSAVLMLLIFASLFLSGIGLYYFGDSDLTYLASLTHIIGGLFLVFPFFWHVVIYKRQKSSN